MRPAGNQPCNTYGHTNIFSNSELERDSVVAKNATTAAACKTYQ
jgi:hypothetical protein